MAAMPETHEHPLDQQCVDTIRFFTIDYVYAHAKALLTQ
jgi:hypothetical protein